MPTTIKALFLDIGGVVLTNGWDHALRRQACEVFGLDFKELDDRHHHTFDTFESGKITFYEYLQRVVFYQPRSFSVEEFRAYICSQWKAFPEMIDFFKGIKDRYGLKVLAVSNEGRELTTERIRQFHLSELFDFFLVSSFVHLRKPDTDLYQLALDCAQVDPEEAVYIDDLAMFVQVAQTLRINAIHHTNREHTCQALAGLGLTVEGRRRAA